MIIYTNNNSLQVQQNDNNDNIIMIMTYEDIMEVDSVIV